MTKIKKTLFNKILFFGCILIIPLSMFIQKLDISSWLSLVLGIIFAIIIEIHLKVKQINLQVVY